MASTHKSLRSGTANKRPTTAIADGQIALNTNSTSPGLFFKDSTGATIIKVGPVHIGTTAPNATPATGGSTGNSSGEVWLDTSLTPPGVKIWDGGAWVNATPAGSTTVQGLLELATNAETQAGSDTSRAVTPAGLQSKVSDSTSTTSSTAIASSTAVKSAYDLANAALPKAGGTVTGTVTFGTTGVLAFEGSTDDGFETVLGAVDPTADRTINLPNVNGTVVVDAGAQTVQFGTGAAATPSVTFTGDTNTGIYSPGADQVAISTNGTGRLFVDASGNVGVGAGSPVGKFDVNGDIVFGDANAGIRSNDQTLKIKHWGSVGIDIDADSNDADTRFFRITKNGETSELLRVTEAGRLGLGTSSPSSILHSRVSTANTVFLGSHNNTGIDFYVNDATGETRVSTKRIGGAGGKFLSFYTDTGSAEAERVRISSGGNVGVGSTSPSARLESEWTGGNQFRAKNGSATFDILNDSTNSKLISSGPMFYTTGTSGPHIFQKDGGSSEVARIDGSGRLLVGTSTARSNILGYQAGAGAARVQSEAITEADASLALLLSRNAALEKPSITLGRGKTTTLGSNGIVSNNDDLGILVFSGNDGTNFVPAASILGEVDGTPGANDMPGRIVFSTTADGASSPTERMRIKKDGTINFSNVAVYADNAAATSGGLAVGDVYRTSTGQLMIRY
jgi:hypothetical protein